MHDKNLTGEQIQKVLDMFLYKALEPIMLGSDVFDSQISIILTVVSTNRKRKLSALSRESLIENLCACLASTDRAAKFERFKSCRVERSFLHGFIRNFLHQNREFMQLYSDYLCGDTDAKTKLENMAYINANTSRFAMWRILQQSSAYLEQFYTYRSMVLDNYLKHSSVQAKAYINSSSSNQLDFLDLRQSILKATIIALDKYDSSKGALTTYINWWVLNAQTCSSEHEYGVAYTVPQSQKRKLAERSSSEVNFSVSFDTVLKSGDDDDNRNLHGSLSDGYTMDDDIEKNEELKIVQHLVKEVDNGGIARLVLDIGEVFTAKELQIMRDHMREEAIQKL